MSGRPPPPAHRRAGLALVGLVVVALALGAVAPAASAAPIPTDDPLNETTTDTGGTATETTDDATSTVETATDDAASSDEGSGTPTEDTVETVSETSAGTVDTVNQTADGVNETAEGLGSELETTTERELADATGVDLTTAIATTVNGTAGSLSVTAEPSFESSLAESGSRADAATPRPASGDGVDSTTGASPGRSRVVAAPERNGPSGPLGPLPAGLTAAGGVLVGAIALRQGLGVGALSGRPRLRSVRAAAGAATHQLGWRGPWRWLAGLFGYQRYDDSDPLEHETRAALLEAIEDGDEPYLAALARTADVPLSTARYHLKILERESAVRSVKLRGKRLYVPAGEEPSALEAALADDGAAAVLETLANSGPETVSGLAARLGRDVSTVTHHLQALESAGLVERERDGRAVRNRLAPAVRETMRPSDGPPAPRARSD